MPRAVERALGSFGRLDSNSDLGELLTQDLLSLRRCVVEGFLCPQLSAIRVDSSWIPFGKYDCIVPIGEMNQLARDYIQADAHVEPPLESAVIGGESLRNYLLAVKWRDSVWFLSGLNTSSPEPPGVISIGRGFLGTPFELKSW